MKKWSVKIVKKDSETGKVIPYAGAEFQLYYPNGKLVSVNGSDVFTTDDNGSITTPEPLPYGKGYYLVEIKAPYGYVLDSTPVYFDVTDESTTKEKGVMLIKTEKSNPPQTGRITIEDFLLPSVREWTKPLLAIPSNLFLFFPGNINPKDMIDVMQMEMSEFVLVKLPEQGTCLYCYGNERYLLKVIAPDLKAKLFGTAGGR